MTESLAIKARGLTKLFGDLRAVDHLDLDVHRGEIVSMAGVSGNGQRELAEKVAG